MPTELQDLDFNRKLIFLQDQIEGLKWKWRLKTLFDHGKISLPDTVYFSVNKQNINYKPDYEMRDYSKKYPEDKFESYFTGYSIRQVGKETKQLEKEINILFNARRKNFQDEVIEGNKKALNEANLILKRNYGKKALKLEGELRSKLESLEKDREKQLKNLEIKKDIIIGVILGDYAADDANRLGGELSYVISTPDKEEYIQQVITPSGTIAYYVTKPVEESKIVQEITPDVKEKKEEKEEQKREVKERKESKEEETKRSEDESNKPRRPGR